MRRFVEGTDRGQSTLFPECLEDWIDEDNPVRVIDVFVEELDLGELGFGGVDPEATGRPSYHPSVCCRRDECGLSWALSHPEAQESTPIVIGASKCPLGCRDSAYRCRSAGAEKARATLPAGAECRARR